MSDELQSIIIDNGSCVLKSGFAGEAIPHSTFTDAIGFSKYPIVVKHGTHKDYYVSDEANYKAGVIELKYPVRHGIIKDWEMMDKIWHHTLYKELRIDPTEHPILFTYNINVPDSQNQKIAEIMFEKYNFPGIYFQPSDKLTLLACEKTTGVVLESGDGVTSISAIYDNFLVKQSVKMSKVAGSSLTSYMISKMNKDEMKFHTSSDILVARDLKEKVCYVTENYEQEQKNNEENGKTKETTFKYPDGQVLKLTDLCFKVPEFLFHPHVLGLDATGIQTLLSESVLACDAHMQPELLQNICLGGGNTMFTGFSKRIENEMKKVFPDNQIGIVTTKQRGFEAWLGGSILCQHSSFLKKIIPKNVFNEEGPTVISRRCK